MQVGRLFHDDGKEYMVSISACHKRICVFSTEDLNDTIIFVSDVR